MYGSHILLTFDEGPHVFDVMQLAMRAFLRQYEYSSASATDLLTVLAKTLVSRNILINPINVSAPPPPPYTHTHHHIPLLFHTCAQKLEAFILGGDLKIHPSKL